MAWFPPLKPNHVSEVGANPPYLEGKQHWQGESQIPSKLPMDPYQASCDRPITPPKTNSSHRKMDGLEYEGFLLGPGLFSGANCFLSGRVKTRRLFQGSGGKPWSPCEDRRWTLERWESTSARNRSWIPVTKSRLVGFPCDPCHHDRGHGSSVNLSSGMPFALGLFLLGHLCGQAFWMILNDRVVMVVWVSLLLRWEGGVKN